MRKHRFSPYPISTILMMVFMTIGATVGKVNFWVMLPLVMLAGGLMGFFSSRWTWRGEE